MTRCTRRTFLAGTTAAFALGVNGLTVERRRPRIAALTTIYPKYSHSQHIVDVYRRSGRAAPVFNDKPLSWNWDYAKRMYDTAKELGFGFMAGSSLPVTWRQPSIDLPLGAEVREAVGIWGGWLDGGDIHVLEAMQSILERRRGGETGVRAVEAFRGERFWKAFEAGSWEAGGWDPKLLEAALSRSNQLKPARETYSHVLPTTEELRRLAPDSYAYRFEYTDGLKASIVQFKGGIVGDCNMAARLKDGSRFSVQFYLPSYTLRNFFSPLDHHIESLFLTGKSPYPVERTQIASALLDRCLDSKVEGHRRIETPDLNIRYRAPSESRFGG